MSMQGVKALDKLGSPPRKISFIPTGGPDVGGGGEEERAEEKQKRIRHKSESGVLNGWREMRRLVNY